MMINQLEGKKLVICIDNKGNEASLEQWKVYQCLPDEEADRHNEIRVIDEEGEDYLYPSDIFSSVSLEASIAKMFIIGAPRDVLQIISFQSHSDFLIKPGAPC